MGILSGNIKSIPDKANIRRPNRRGPVSHAIRLRHWLPFRRFSKSAFKTPFQIPCSSYRIQQTSNASTTPHSTAPPFPFLAINNGFEALEPHRKRALQLRGTFCLWLTTRELAKHLYISSYHRLFHALTWSWVHCSCALSIEFPVCGSPFMLYTTYWLLMDRRSLNAAFLIVLGSWFGTSGAATCSHCSWDNWFTSKSRRRKR